MSRFRGPQVAHGTLEDAGVFPCVSEPKVAGATEKAPDALPLLPETMVVIVIDVCALTRPKKINTDRASPVLTVEKLLKRLLGESVAVPDVGRTGTYEHRRTLRRSQANNRSASEIVKSSLKKKQTLLEISKHHVAGVTEQPTHLARAVINLHACTAWLQQGGTDRTLPTLFIEEGLPVFWGQSVLAEVTTCVVHPEFLRVPKLPTTNPGLLTFRVGCVTGGVLHSQSICVRRSPRDPYLRVSCDIRSLLNSAALLALTLEPVLSSLAESKRA